MALKEAAIEQNAVGTRSGRSAVKCLDPTGSACASREGCSSCLDSVIVKRLDKSTSLFGLQKYREGLRRDRMLNVHVH